MTKPIDIDGRRCISLSGCAVSLGISRQMMHEWLWTGVLDGVVIDTDKAIGGKKFERSHRYFVPEEFVLAVKKRRKKAGSLASAVEAIAKEMNQ